MINRCDDFLAEAHAAQIVQRHVGVLDDIMQHGDDLLGFGLHLRHDTQGMGDVGRAAFIDLPAMLVQRQADGVLNRCHRHSTFSAALCASHSSTVKRCLKVKASGVAPC